MKKYILSLVMALVALCSVTIFAAAAEADWDITVQLNGQNLEFTDAKPQVKDSRTFLPYRAVFEAMGAEVGYEGNVVTAKRGDTELSMTIGETTATVTRGGVAEELTMDVAPYVDTATWRTYVPVRFAADAFGCNVGWDQDAMTAIIVDVDTLVDEALDGKAFTKLEQFMEYSQKYNEGSWAMDGAMDASVSLFGSKDLPLLIGTLDGIVSDNAAGEMGMTMELDMTALMSHMAYLSGMTLADMGVTEEELRMSMAMDMKMDLESGAVCIKMDDATYAQMGLPAGAWLSMNLNDLMAGEGMEWDYAALMADTEALLAEIDMADLLKVMAASVSLDGCAADGYTTLAATLNDVLTALSDQGFQKTSTGYETTLTLDVEGVELTVSLGLTTTSAGTVNGYSMDLAMSVPLDEETKASLTESGLPIETVTLAVSTCMDQNDKMTATIQIAAAPLFTCDMNMAVNYAATTKAPNTTLPANAVVLDYMELMAGIADLQE